MKEIYLAGGCFWGVEKYLSIIRGVIDTQTGYANGNTDETDYESVCSGSGHTEAVKVVYDNNIISLEKLLSIFYESIDPLSVNKQGNDRGIQYRTGIYYTDHEDVPAIKNSLFNLEKKLGERPAIEFVLLKNWCVAEECHQKYLYKNPRGYCHISPKLFEKAERANSIVKYERKTDEDLKKELTNIQYSVTMENSTEKPFTGEYWDFFGKGVYVDITTGEPLFLSTDKFDSGCGWPSFSAPVSPEVVIERMDKSHGMSRVEVRSRSGNVHLGHVFEDGPVKEGGLRYCINSASLRFVPYERMEEESYGWLMESFE